MKRFLMLVLWLPIATAVVTANPEVSWRNQPDTDVGRLDLKTLVDLAGGADELVKLIEPVTSEAAENDKEELLFSAALDREETLSFAAYQEDALVSSGVALLLDKELVFLFDSGEEEVRVPVILLEVEVNGTDLRMVELVLSHLPPVCRCPEAGGACTSIQCEDSKTCKDPGSGHTGTCGYYPPRRILIFQ